jgi:AAA+ superfamily predicted ATPase
MELPQNKLIDFSPIIGHDELKITLYNLFYVFVNKHAEWIEYLKAVNNESAQAYLLLGLPGTGKSEIMKCIHASLKNNIYIDSMYVQGSAMQGTVGNNAKRIEDIFNQARLTPKLASVLLVDEIDGVMQIKQGVNSVERTNALLSELEGLKDSSKLIVVGTANSISKCEPAAVSRFQIMNIMPPTIEDRKQFIMRYFYPIKYTEDLTPHLQTLINYTEGLTGRNYSQISSALKMHELVHGNIPLDELLKRISVFYRRMGLVNNNEEIKIDAGTKASDIKW